MRRRWEASGKWRHSWAYDAGVLAGWPARGAARRKLGLGVSLVFICEDAVAIYREITFHGIDASEPFVGNGMWNFSVTDPDGYRIEFESPTDTPEDTKLSEVGS